MTDLRDLPELGGHVGVQVLCRLVALVLILRLQLRSKPRYVQYIVATVQFLFLGIKTTRPNHI